MNAMFGGGGFSLPWSIRTAAGLCVGVDKIVLVRLCAPEAEGEPWTVTESRTAEHSCTVPLDASALAAAARSALTSAGWADLPLALALPAAEADSIEMDLPAPLAGEEMRDALLWSLRAEADEEGRGLPEDLRLCCARLSENSDCCWAAWMDGERVQEFFAAFRDEGISLKRITICPPDGGAYAGLIEAARGPRMPWEAERTGADERLPAVYAALLLRPRAETHLYWAPGRALVPMLRAYAAGIIAVLSTAVFLAAAAADIAGCAALQRACDAAEEELALRDADVRRMEAFSAMRSNAAQREQLLAEFSAASLPIRALLVYLGSAAADGVHLTGIKAEEDVEIEGTAVNYEALSAMMERMDAAHFFSSDVMLGEAGQAQDNSGRIRFVLRADW